MKKLLSYLFFILLANQVLSQGEEVGPLMANPYLNPTNEVSFKSSSDTFDSTFIYLSDTLVLPLFDDFSSSKFQEYNASYSDPGVTFDKAFRLLDLSSTPLPNTVLYTAQPTFRRTFDVAGATFTDTYLIPESIQLGDLSAYPVSYTTIDAYPPYYIYDTLDYPNDSDTIWILDAELFQDSATQFFAPLSDPGKYWLDNSVYHNYTMAVNPWSLGVATFDGLDETGFPYAIGTTTSGFADYLTSKPIDISALNAADSVYLSWIFQPQGLCDPPEAGDSLHLEFYIQSLDDWITVWKGGGTAVSDWKIGHFRLDDPSYFSDAFRFRFSNYGALSGSLDHFHLDYVHLRALSGYQDTLFKDFALVYPIGSLLKDYSSVPWDHYKNNSAGKMSDSVLLVVRNGSNIPENNSLDGSVTVSYSGVDEGSFTVPGPSLANGDLNYLPLTTYYSYHDFSAGYAYDPMKVGIEQEWKLKGEVAAQFPNFNGNDTCIGKQVFRNYYSYDDGSAELAYGPTGTQARLAIQYTPYEADSLIGAMIHFVPSVNDVSNKLFLLAVWDDDNGVPGQLIYEDNVFFPKQPHLHSGTNNFSWYFFQDTVKVPVTGTFYIGWRQFDADRLNVGLDMNTPNNDKNYYSIDGGSTWSQSIYPGSVMIRPIFSTDLDVTLGIVDKEKEAELVLYPNPTGSVVHVKNKVNPDDEIEVYDMTGVLLVRSVDEQIDLSAFSNGIYLFRVANRHQTYKIIKK